MKVLLLKDVYKLGRAGDVKKVADGYGRNYLIPQGMAVLATAGALTRVDRLRSRAAAQRAALNEEMQGVAAKIKGLVLVFSSKAGETGKLYGSVTTHEIAEAINAKTGLEIDKRQVESEPIRTLGEHVAHVRLTIDMVPEIKVVVYREGEAPVAAAAVAAPVIEEVQAEVEAEAIEEEAAE
jgi:large subunit ribosomal protein L9